MKTMKILIGVMLVTSLGLNVWLWEQRAAQLAATEAARAGAAEAEALRADNEALKSQRTAKPVTTDADARELARLRNEVGQLRKQTGDGEAQRNQAAREVAQLRSQLATAAQNLEELRKGSADLLKMTPEQMEQAKQRAQAVACVNNLKQIGLAARLFANDHGNVFPPDLVTLKNELVTPKILFCPGAPGGVQATEWTQLNPTTISYQFLNPGGNEADPQKPLSACPIHGNIGYSDGSVQMGRK